MQTAHFITLMKDSLNKYHKKGILRGGKKAILVKCAKKSLRNSSIHASIKSVLVRTTQELIKYQSENTRLLVCLVKHIYSSVQVTSIQQVLLSVQSRGKLQSANNHTGL